MADREHGHNGHQHTAALEPAINHSLAIRITPQHSHESRCLVFTRRAGADDDGVALGELVEVLHVAARHGARDLLREMKKSGTPFARANVIRFDGYFSAPDRASLSGHPGPFQRSDAGRTDGRGAEAFARARPGALRAPRSPPPRGSPRTGSHRTAWSSRRAGSTARGSARWPARARPSRSGARHSAGRRGQMECWEGQASGRAQPTTDSRGAAQSQRTRRSRNRRGEISSSRCTIRRYIRSRARCGPGWPRALTRCWTARPVKAVTPRTLLVANMLALRRRRGVGPGGRRGEARRRPRPDPEPRSRPAGDWRSPAMYLTQTCSPAAPKARGGAPGRNRGRRLVVGPNEPLTGGA